MKFTTLKHQTINARLLLWEKSFHVHFREAIKEILSKDSYLPFWTGSRSHTEASETRRLPPGEGCPGSAAGFPFRPETQSVTLGWADCTVLIQTISFVESNCIIIENKLSDTFSQFFKLGENIFIFILLLAALVEIILIHKCISL